MRHYPQRVLDGTQLLSIMDEDENAVPECCKYDSESAKPYLSSRMFEFLLKTATAKCGAAPRAAVLAAPGHLFCGQRRIAALRKALTASELQHSQICPSPLLACVAYGLDESSKATGRSEKVGVVSIGGHSMRVSVVHLHRGRMRLEASSSDRTVSGKAFDACLFAAVKRQMAPDATTLLSARIARRTRKACVEARHRLSVPSCRSTDLLVEGGCVKTRSDFKMRLSKMRFESISRTLVDKAVRSAKATLARMLSADDDDDENASLSSLSYVVLVGGMMSMPKLQQEFAAAFGNRTRVLSTIAPNEVLVRGAALQSKIVESLVEARRKDAWKKLSQHGPSADAGNVRLRISGLFEAVVRACCDRAVSFHATVDDDESRFVEIYEDDRILARLALDPATNVRAVIQTNARVDLSIQRAGAEPKLITIARDPSVAAPRYSAIPKEEEEEEPEKETSKDEEEEEEEDEGMLDLD